MKTPTPPKKRRASPASGSSAAGSPAAAARAPTYDDLLAIVRLIESGSRFTDFRLRSGDIEVEVHRGNGAAAPPAPGAPPPPASRESSAAVANSPSYSPAANQGAVSSADLPAGTHVVRSPMVGTFYRAAEPGAAPFAKEGGKVKAADIVCIIEVMKLMNSVAAGVKGVVTHVFVENAQMVEYGQPLIGIRPE